MADCQPAASCYGIHDHWLEQELYHSSELTFRLPDVECFLRARDSPRTNAHARFCAGILVSSTAPTIALRKVSPRLRRGEDSILAGRFAPGTEALDTLRVSRALYPGPPRLSSGPMTCNRLTP